ncbi:YncE family protein [uncultured Lacinutrix sp.]|uniref:YncE family protein n=1 Tax=uncultured Lacinutrix sp. TaxID=574032 RepID=UPI0026251EEA|nr:YncE family protein [uncultured Lacinutrix sp.]
MKKQFLFLALISLTFYFTSCETETLDKEIENIEKNEDQIQEKGYGHYYRKNYFLVANRGASTVSIFNAKTTTFIQDITLPDPGAQPTYLAYSRWNNSFYVGDFANSKVLYYDADTFDYQGEITIEQGAFHMWINDYAGQLWVNNIVSKTTSVIDLSTNTLIQNLPLPTNEIPELTANAVQHDVTISPSGYAAYVTILDGNNTSYVVMYNTQTLQYIRHEVVGGDAHILPVGTKLYVPTQNANEISVLNRFNLNPQTTIPFQATHGITRKGKYVFTTGITENKLGVINRFTNQVVSETTTEFNIPHNVEVNRRGNVLFVSFSGSTSTKVAFYKIKRNGTLIKLSDYDSGLNPFGVLEY